MRVLTFNSHQPYVHMFATAFPWQLGVIIPREESGRPREWEPAVRPQPENVRLYPSLAAALGDSKWDWVLTHNVDNLIEVRNVQLPKVFVVHGTLSGRIIEERSGVDKTEFLEKLHVVLKAHRCRVVYISELKRQDHWPIPGVVIENAINPEHYGGYRGDVPGVLQVGNFLKERGDMLGWPAHETVCKGITSLLLGRNPTLPESRRTTGWDDLKEQYRSYRVYLHTAIHPFEDGFNLSLMEAMATGMPIATMANPTSPVKDGVEGVVADTAEKLRDKVLRLLDDREEACRMGQAAGLKLRARFPLARFQYAWRTLVSRLR